MWGIPAADGRRGKPKPRVGPLPDSPANSAQSSAAALRRINSKAGFTRRPFFAGGAFLFLKTTTEFQGLFAGAGTGFLKIVPATQSWQLEASGRKKGLGSGGEKQSMVFNFLQAGEARTQTLQL